MFVSLGWECLKSEGLEEIPLVCSLKPLITRWLEATPGTAGTSCIDFEDRSFLVKANHDTS